MSRQMPASGRRGPQSQPDMQWALRRKGKPRTQSVEPSTRERAYSRRMKFTGEAKSTSMRFSPSRRKGSASASHRRCMLSASSTVTPFSRTVARVSSPSQMSSSRSQASSSAVRVKWRR